MDSKLQQQIYQYAETLPAQRKATLKMANPEMLYPLYLEDLAKYGTKEQKDYANKILPSLKQADKKEVVKSDNKTAKTSNTGNVWNDKTKIVGTQNSSSSILAGPIKNETEFSSKTSYAKTLSPDVQKSIKTELQKKAKELENQLKEAKDKNGFIGKSWDWIKNTTTLGAGSNKTQKEIDTLKKQLEDLDKNPKNLDKVYKNITGKDLNKAELQKFQKGEISLKASESLKGYQEGQEMAVDVASDLVSGVAAVGIYTAAVAAAPFTGGASIAVGVLAAGAASAAIKTGIKYADAKTGGREYDSLGYDLATGAFSGVLAPVTGGVGGAAGKTIATKLGVQAVKQVGKEIVEETVETGVKQGIKTVLTNPTGYEYVGGTFLKRSIATGTEMAVDGAMGGSVDNMFRASLNGDNIVDAGVQGFVGGLVLSPVIGGGFKVAGKTGSKLFKSVEESSSIAKSVEHNANVSQNPSDLKFGSSAEPNIIEEKAFKQHGTAESSNVKIIANEPADGFQLNDFITKTSHDEIIIDKLKLQEYLNTHQRFSRMPEKMKGRNIPQVDNINSVDDLEILNKLLHEKTLQGMYHFSATNIKTFMDATKENNPREIFKTLANVKNNEGDFIWQSMDIEKALEITQTRDQKTILDLLNNSQNENIKHSPSLILREVEKIKTEKDLKIAEAIFASKHLESEKFQASLAKIQNYVEKDFVPKTDSDCDILKILLNAEDSTGNPRFDLLELKAIKKSLISDIKPQDFEVLVNSKKSTGENYFSSFEIKKIIKEGTIKENIAKFESYKKSLPKIEPTLNGKFKNEVNEYCSSITKLNGEKRFTDADIKLLQDNLNLETETDLKLFKSLVNSKFSNGNNRYDASQLNSIMKNLTDFKKTDSNKYEEFVKNGVFDLIVSNKIRPEVLENIQNRVIPANILSDIQKINKGESIVLKFAKDSPHSEVIKKIPQGEVATIGDKLYTNENGRLIELNMTKEKYLELFPPLERFGISQGGLSDCWLVSTLDNLMDLPNGRNSIYKLIRQDGDDIYIKFPNGKNEIKFSNSEILKSPTNQNLNGAKGLQMIQQAYAIHRNGDYTGQQFEDILHMTNVKELMDKLDMGDQKDAIENITGKPTGVSYFNIDNTIDDKFKIIELIENHSNNPNTFVGFGTNMNGDLESTINSSYDIVSQHAYSIKGYNKQSGMVGISNPHNTNLTTNVPIYELLKNIASLTLMELN